LIGHFIDEYWLDREEIYRAQEAGTKPLVPGLNGGLI
jgi:hypothetical protein